MADRQNSRDRESVSIELSLIAGISALNPRAAGDEDIEGLAASLLASGQLQPLLATVENDTYVVLDGWRRWRAMRHLVDQGLWSLQHPVAIELLYCDEASLREIAIAANTMRRPLHPVEEFKAFVAMEAAGFDEERIAKDFGLSLRHVRQRLALGRLAPKILDAWLAGALDAEEAQAFTIAESQLAQEEVFDQLSITSNLFRAYDIKKLLRAGAMRGDCPEAIFVGANTYLAAGGKLDEDLFEEQKTFRDGALLKRLAHEKLIREGEAIAEREGWGFVVDFNDCKKGLFFHAGAERFETVYGDLSADFLAGEKTRLQQIDVEIDKLREKYIDNELMISQLETEREEIEIRAYLRSVPQAKRAELGLVVGLGLDGGVEITRGLIAEKPAATDDASTAEPDPPAKKKKTATPAGKDATPEPEPENNSKALRAVLDAAIDESLYTCIRARPDLALMIAVAKLGTIYGSLRGIVDFSGRLPSSAKLNSELLIRIIDLDLEDALAICALAPLCDLTTAFTELVAQSISIGDAGSLSQITPLAEALAARGAPLASAFDQALDRTAYFEAAAKQACLDAIDNMDIPGVDRKVKKPILAGIAVEAAREKHWLPKPLSDWAALPATSPERPRDDEDSMPLAKAMDRAISADETAKTETTMAVRHFLDTVNDPKTRIAQPRIKASILYEAYLRFAAKSDDLPVLSIIGFGEAITACGIEKKRLKTGVHYFGIALREDYASIAGEAA